MMKLSLLRSVYGTLTEDWNSPLAEQILAPWGFDPGSVKYFRGSANFLFVFKRDGKGYFLRFNHEEERKLEAVQAEVAILNQLRAADVRVSKPVLSTENRYVETVATELGAFHAVVFERLPGVHWEFDELTDEQFERWGRELGKLHRALKQLPVSVRQGRPHWREQLASLQHPEADALLQWMQTLDDSPEGTGIIHYDFELDNVRWDGDAAGILDFDDCTVWPFTADIAFALRDLLEDGFDPEGPRFRAFVIGYTAENERVPDAVSHLPKFLRAHELLLQARLRRAVDIEDNPSDPDWLRGLREKLWQRANR